MLNTPVFLPAVLLVTVSGPQHLWDTPPWPAPPESAPKESHATATSVVPTATLAVYPIAKAAVTNKPTAAPNLKSTGIKNTKLTAINTVKPTATPINTVPTASDTQSTDNCPSTSAVDSQYPSRSTITTSLYHPAQALFTKTSVINERSHAFIMYQWARTRNRNDQFTTIYNSFIPSGTCPSTLNTIGCIEVGNFTSSGPFSTHWYTVEDRWYLEYDMRIVVKATILNFTALLSSLLHLSYHAYSVHALISVVHTHALLFKLSASCLYVYTKYTTSYTSTLHLQSLQYLYLHFMHNTSLSCAINMVRPRAISNTYVSSTLPSLQSSVDNSLPAVVSTADPSPDLPALQTRKTVTAPAIFLDSVLIYPRSKVRMHAPTNHAAIRLFNAYNWVRVRNRAN
jgi:hypothetical protein